MQKGGPFGSVTFHHDNGDHTKGLDLASLLSEYEPGTQVYYCGPAGFMEACARALEHWPKAAVHFEYFKAPTAPAGAEVEKNQGLSTDEFDVFVASTGQTVHVEPHQTITEALADAGVAIDTSCVSGLCGTCRVRYLSGEPDHRDYILSDEEKKSYLTPCVSRCLSGPMVLISETPADLVQYWPKAAGQCRHWLLRSPGNASQPPRPSASRR